MTAQELARQVLKVLDLQQRYFSAKTNTLLAECRDAERRLRQACEQIINPPQPGLFDADIGGQG